MPLDLELSDLNDLDRIRDALSRNDPRGQFTALSMDRLTIADDAVDGLIAAVERQLARAGRPAARDTRVRLVADAVTIRRDGRDLKADVFARLSERFAAERVTLDDGQPALHADEAMQDRAAELCVGADCIVSVGGGTITDIAKIAALRNGVPVHVVVQTAASVDGFTDNFSVVLQKGVKRTLLTRWPDEVLTDGRVVAGAPPALSAAGLGEMLSMFVAPGDWLLAFRLGQDDSYTPVLVEMLAVCGAGIRDWSVGVGRAEVDGLRRLASGLAMRGIVTGVGGTSASLSGMEHLVSHMLDMHGAETGEPTGLHGAQVGVASVIASAAWEHFCARMEAEPIDPARLFGDAGVWEDRVRTAFAGLDRTGRLGGQCWGHYRLKLAKWHANRPAVERFFADWPAIRDARDAVVLKADAVASCLHDGRAPKRFGDLDPAPSERLIRWAALNCQFMRERFTVADLLTFAGWWDEEGVTAVFDRVERACAAAEAGARAA
ncbi:iron-containing alcohol dehydrogenase [Lichenibacterium dinghuense]|uniref:iron-containing alcohol dehydrogenase n=1 Tax=Lichenibacterium dinghuense TaxID=2895977 RepID=UPI001F2D9A89|nr:iron-containing alcohol dehydrogenase [Lichenibacterium sp. 6Y81]